MVHRILLVDDDLFFPARIEALLRDGRFALQCVAHADIASIARQPPAAILVNVAGATDERLRLLRELKSHEATRAIPVLAFAGHLETQLHRRAREAGADKVVANSAMAGRPAQLIEDVIARVAAGKRPDESVEE